MKNIIDIVDKYNIRCLMDTVIVCFTICLAFGMRTSSPLYLAFGGMYFILSSKEVCLEKNERYIALLISAMFSLFTTMGNIDTILDVDFLPWPITVLLCLYGFYLCFKLFITYIIVHVRQLNFVELDRESSNKKNKLVFVISLICLVLVWGLGLLISYPGNTTKDSNVYFDMVLGNRDMWGAISPIYILSIRYVWNIGLAIFGNVNAGLAMFSFLQIIVLAVTVSFLIYRLYSFGVKKPICLVVWLFYAIVPYNVQLPHTIWRDIPFSVAAFIIGVIIWDLYMNRDLKTQMAELLELLILVVAIIVLCIMKGNGLFAYIFFMPFGIALFLKKNKKVVLSLLIAFVLARIVQGPVSDKIMTDNIIWMNEMKAEATSGDETMVSEVAQVVQVENATDSYNASGIYIITAQQLARVAVDRTDLTDEEYERLNEVIDIEYIRKKYNPNVSDRAMAAVNGNISSKEYLKEWAYFGLKYPVQYVLAYKDQTIGYWYPDVQSWVYDDVIRENDFGLYKDSILPDTVREKWTALEKIYLEVPLYGLLWSIGFIVWITLLSMSITYIKKGIKEVFLYCPILGVWATLLVAAPAYAEFRYIYSMFLYLPLSILIPFIGECKESNLTE